MYVESISMDSIRAAVDSTGSHWFSPATMRFFRTRLPQSGLRDGRGRLWFVSSEAYSRGPRRYNVRCFSITDGRVHTHGDFQAHATRHAATRAMHRAIAASADPRTNDEE